LLPTSYQTYADKIGSYESSAVPLTVGWSRDRRDSALAPNSGIYQRANMEVSPAGDAHYLRATYQIQQYIPLSKQLTAAFNADVGVGYAIGDLPYPVFKNFFGGGLGSVRGFEQGSLGPRDASGSSLGGTSKISLNAEVLAPFPGVGNDKSLRMYSFIDAGSVSGPDGVNDNAASLRVSLGVGISWLSPVGPLRLAFAKPIRKFDGDKIQNMQFQIGTSF
jgi:outer membrane protein insertion porin family